MTVKQTRCPFCHSAFYITSLQLNAYRGQARCGQCHQVFDATENMVTPKPASAQPAPKITINTTPVASVPANTQPEVVSIPNTGLGADSVAVPNAIIENVAAESVNIHHLKPLNANPTVVIPEPTASQSQSVEQPSAQDDDSKLLFSDTQGFSETEETPIVASNGMPLIDDSINEDFLSNNFDKVDRLKSTELSKVDSLHGAADESWINDLLNDPAPAKPASTQMQQPAPVQVQKQAHPAFDPTTTESKAARPDAAALPIDRGVYSKLPEAINRREIDEDEDLLSFLNRTGAVSMPLSSPHRTDLSTPKPASHRILTPTVKHVRTNYLLGWGLMSLLMAGLLVTQYIYFNFERLAFDPKTSAQITRLCSITGCQIPYMNVDELHIGKLKVIASNSLGQTTFRGQISNTAKMSQPFPALRLTLKQDGKAIASQIVQPRQYLTDDLKTFTRLATKTPYPFSFTIKTKRSAFDDYSIEPQYR